MSKLIEQDKDRLQTHFAFFWIGKDVAIPDYLVKSIRHIYKNEAYIYHLTDHRTPNISGVDITIRQSLPEKIMLARLKAYKSIKSSKIICYLDADSLIISKVYLPELHEFNAGLIERNDHQIILDDSSLNIFPEFKNKTIYDVMPIFFGFIATDIGSIFFTNIEKKLRHLSQEYHMWFGDQKALAIEWKENKKDYLILDQNKYLYITKNKLSIDEINKLTNNNTMIVTFKGKASKIYIEETLNNLLLS